MYHAATALSTLYVGRFTLVCSHGISSFSNCKTTTGGTADQGGGLRCLFWAGQSACCRLPKREHKKQKNEQNKTTNGGGAGAGAAPLLHYDFLLPPIKPCSQPAWCHGLHATPPPTNPSPPAHTQQVPALHPTSHHPQPPPPAHTHSSPAPAAPPPPTAVCSVVSPTSPTLTHSTITQRLPLQHRRLYCHRLPLQHRRLRCLRLPLQHRRLHLHLQQAPALPVGPATLPPVCQWAACPVQVPAAAAARGSQGHRTPSPTPLAAAASAAAAPASSAIAAAGVAGAAAAASAAASAAAASAGVAGAAAGRCCCCCWYLMASVFSLATPCCCRRLHHLRWSSSRPPGSRLASQTRSEFCWASPAHLGSASICLVTKDNPLVRMPTAAS